SYAEPSGKAHHLIADKAQIMIEKNGPYHAHNIDLNDIPMTQGSCPDKYVLCRCGASKNKPYCDGSHLSEGWRDS
ncbi:MAG: CDGSH iron-sulfur domain-containing protein, partial [Marinicella sp.]